MGNLCTTTTDSTEHKLRRRGTSQIDKQLQSERKSLDKVIKLLLLGPGDSGKSTILKQFCILYGPGFSDHDRSAFHTVIIVNIVSCAKTLVSQMKALEIPYGFEPPKDVASVVSNCVGNGGGGDNNPLDWIKDNLTLKTRRNPANKLSKHGASGGDGSQDSELDSGSLHENIAEEVSEEEMADQEEENKEGDEAETHQEKTIFSGSRKGSGKGCDSEQPKETSLTAILAQKLYHEQMQREGIHDANEIDKYARIVQDMQIEFGYLGNTEIKPEEIEAIQNLWNDSGVQYCYSRANEFQLIESCGYFLDNLDRIFTPGYIPTDADILRCRIMTSTITESRFKIEQFEYRIYDVGGQRSERKKWAPYFDDVTAIIFVAAISAFDQVCFEDNQTNRIVEAWNVFSSICNHPMFKKTAMLLFLNKTDLLKAKLERNGTRIADYFPDFEMSNDYKSACAYFSTKFEELNKYPNEKHVYTYFMWATDHEQTRNVLDAVTTVLVNLLLKSVNLE
ncbi:guanine nucleotide binding protein, alpha subunit [Obelidium mucronatum]|nr:guanine nucleotide binding protein, alpha subunit [Obelidium mucronatum]